MTRLLPYPFLTLALILMWLMLTSFSLAHLLLGTLVALIAARVMAALQPPSPRIRRWREIPRLSLIMLWDVLWSNFDVASAIVTRRPRRPRFVEVPLTLRDRNGLAVLAIVITATPGTAWVSYDTKNGILKLHVFDEKEEGYWPRLIRGRYEAPLMEIFE